MPSMPALQELGRRAVRSAGGGALSRRRASFLAAAAAPLLTCCVAHGGAQRPHQPEPLRGRTAAVAAAESAAHPSPSIIDADMDSIPSFLSASGLWRRPSAAAAAASGAASAARSHRPRLASARGNAHAADAVRCCCKSVWLTFKLDHLRTEAGAHKTEYRRS